MLCRAGATKGMGLFWALICVMNFAGTIQASTTADPGDNRIAHPTSSATSPAEITTKETTSIAIPTTENPTKATTSAASVSPSGTKSPTKEMSTLHTTTTEEDTTPDEGATTNTTVFETNATDNALHFNAMAETSSAHMDTTEQATTPAVTQPAAMTVPHSPRNSDPPENVELRVDQKTTSIPQSKPQTTLIALITTGLVVAALILCAYFLSNRQSWSPGSRRLDEDYAGNDSPDNTLISVATRDQPGQPDKPNLKAGNQENGTGQAVTPVATNGHSNKQHIVADTEL
ncbi:hematopoietic progenitor cell antigen CD34 isoform X2 [Lissotriton helveticus]